MNKLQVIAYLRQNCIVQDPEVTPNDPAFLALTNEELELVISVALLKESPHDTVDNVPAEVLYPTILVAKKELYYQLASKTAPLYPISLGDDDGGLKKNIRFDHYMTLVTKVSQEYDLFKSTGTPVVVGQILLSSRYHSKRNYDLAVPPSGSLVADLVRNTSIDLSWSVRNINRFYSYILYKSTEPIVDLYDPTNPIKETAEKVMETYDIHSNLYRISGLTASTLYYVALVVQEANGLKGFSEISFTTQL